MYKVEWYIEEQIQQQKEIEKLIGLQNKRENEENT
jgi:hypothetical protein